MTLIQSISGVRGTVGGSEGQNLTPIEVVKFCAGFGNWLQREGEGANKRKILVGRDARISGNIFQPIIMYTLVAQGFEVVDLGKTTTPTLAFNIKICDGVGGIMITGSHNPMEWNALKFFNAKGEFISKKEAEEIYTLIDKKSINFSKTQELGKIIKERQHLNRHIEAICDLSLVNKKNIKKKNFRILVDGINSVGGVAVPQLLSSLGVEEIKCIHSVPNGKFVRDPEPIAKNLKTTSQYIKKGKYDIGIVVDPDVDRLVFICCDGSFFNEEYTLVAIADYVLKHSGGNSVSTLSSSNALEDITKKRGGEYFSTTIGEVNVVEAMKKQGVTIGGEGSGGVIYPKLHYTRDALVGIALFLSHLAEFKGNIIDLRNTYPNYFMSKESISLNKKENSKEIIEFMYKTYSNHKTDTRDGIKIIFEDKWVHFRPSNTEPILRIYVEAKCKETADIFAKEMKQKIYDFIKNKK